MGVGEAINKREMSIRMCMVHVSVVSFVCHYIFMPPFMLIVYLVTMSPLYCPIDIERIFIIKLQ